MPQVKITSVYERKIDKSSKRSYPVGWIGNVDADVFADIKAKGCGDKWPPEELKKPTRKRTTSKKPKDDPTKAEAVKDAQDAVTAAQKALDEADSDEAKAAAQTALDEAKDKLAQLDPK